MESRLLHCFDCLIKNNRTPILRTRTKMWTDFGQSIPRSYSWPLVATPIRTSAPTAIPAQNHHLL